MAEILNLYKKAQVPVRGWPIYPSLSDSQQLALIKVLIEGRWIEFAHYRKGDLKSGCYYAGKVDFKAHSEGSFFDEVIADLLCKLWSNLNSTDKRKVQDILMERTWNLA